jgi:hypothetical protein
MMRLALALVLLVACGGGRTSPRATPASPARSSPAELERIDVFGSRKLGRDAVLSRWGDRLAQLVRHPEQLEGKGELEAQIAAAGDFTFVDLAIVTYPPPAGTYLTVDLVDAEDRARRMKHAPAPTGTHADPDGLLALWDEYQPKALGMMMDGTVKPGAEKCPFWHCFTFAHESLILYRDAFARRVPAVERALVTVLREEKRDDRRAAAAFLLAHLPSGQRVVELMLPSITDPSVLVRNNAMRVLAMTAMHHPEIAIPVTPILEALHFPSTLDRNKASAILAGITRREPTAEVRAQILAGAGELLVDMLALKQPNNHDFAYQVLKQISGRDLGEHAIDAWRAWFVRRADTYQRSEMKRLARPLRGWTRAGSSFQPAAAAASAADHGLEQLQAPCRSRERAIAAPSSTRRRHDFRSWPA